MGGFEVRGKRRVGRIVLGCTGLLAGVLVACGPGDGSPDGTSRPQPASEALHTSDAALESVLHLGERELQRVWSVASDGRGGVVAAGTFRGRVDVQPGRDVHWVPSAGELDGFLVRYSGGHRVMWARSFGSSGYDELYDVLVSADYVYAVGYQMDTRTRVPQGVVAKYLLRTGELRWKKTFDSEFASEARAIALEAGGDIVVGGSYSFDVDMDPSPRVERLTSRTGRQGFIGQYSSDGLLRWYAGAWGDRGAAVRDVAVKESGQVAVVGDMFGGGSVGLDDPVAVPGYGQDDGFAALFDRYGTELWAHTVGGEADDGLRTVSFHPEWGVVTGGFFREKARLHARASDAVKSRGGKDMLYVAYQLGSGLAWYRSFGSAGDDAVHDLHVDVREDALYATGMFSDDVNFAAHSQPAFFLTAGAAKHASFTARYDISKKPRLQWAHGPEGEPAVRMRPSAVGDAIALGPKKEVWSAGTFMGRISFHMGPTLSAPDLDGLVVRFVQPH